jgi:predicted RNase H-like HicB family nuclease
MSRIVNDDKDGNWVVRVYGPKQCVAAFQTRTLEDAVQP